MMDIHESKMPEVNTPAYTAEDSPKDPAADSSAKSILKTVLSKNRGKITAILILALLAGSLAGNAYLVYRYKRLSAHDREISALYTEYFFQFDSLTVDSFNEKVLSGEDFIVVMSRPNCPNCKRLEQPFINLAVEKDIADKFFHLNVVRLQRDGEAWSQFKTQYDMEGTPTFARFAGGKLVSNIGWTAENGISIEMVERWIDEQSDYFD